MEVERRVTIDELAQMVGVSSYTLRTWISSYKFSQYVYYDNFLGNKKKLNIVLNKKFCKEFIPYLALKDVKHKKYVEQFIASLDKLSVSRLE